MNTNYLTARESRCNLQSQTGSKTSEWWCIQGDALSSSALHGREKNSDFIRFQKKIITFQLDHWILWSQISKKDHKGDLAQAPSSSPIKWQ